MNPMHEGTKVAAHYRLELPGHGTARVRLRLTPDGAPVEAFRDFDRS